MTSKRDALVATLWRGRDPFAGFPARLYEVDTQGWGEHHAYLHDIFDAYSDPLIVEIGVWKGASSITMGTRMRERAMDGAILSVDTWLGAVDHWVDDGFWNELGWDHGYPSINRKFMANIVDAGLSDRVVPLPLDSINAAEVLAHFGIAPDVVYIDAGHEFASVIADLRAWWPLLRPGGLLIGDDYYTEVPAWPGVRAAFDNFFGELDLLPLEHVHGKCRVMKPLA